MKSLIRTIACGTLLAGLLIPAIGLSKAMPVENLRVNPVPIEATTNLLQLNPRLALYISVGGGYRRGSYGRRCWRVCGRRCARIYGWRACRRSGGCIRRCRGGGWGGGHWGGHHGPHYGW